MLFLLIGALLLLINPQPDDSITVAYVRVSDQYRTTYAYQEADQYLQSALIRQPWNASLHLRSSDIALGLRQPDRSASELDLAASLGADTFEIDVRRARLAEANGQFENAASFWLNAINAQPNEASLQVNLIKAYVQAAKFDQAAQAAKDWLDRSNSPQARLTYAKLIALDNPAEAQTQFQSLVVAESQEFLLALNDPQSIDPAYRDVALGRAYLSSNDLVLASRAFQAAITLNANYAEAYAYAGFVQDQLGQDGGTLIDRALQIDRASATAHYFRALHLIAQGDPSSALIDLQAAISIDPKNYLVMIALGRTYSLQSNFAEAEKWLTSARDLFPNTPLSWQALCELYVGRNYGSREQAVAVAQQLMNLSPDSSDAHVWLGRAYFLSGDWDSAERELRQAVQIDPASASAHYFLGRFLKSDSPEGRVEFERALALDPNGPIGKLVKRELLIP